MSPLAAIVVNFHSEATLGPTIESLLAQTRPPERVLIVDCGSRDAEWKQRPWARAAPVEILEPGENLGFTGGNNLAWKRCGPEVERVLFLNPDVILPPTVLAVLESCLQEPEHASVAVVSPRLLGYDFVRRAATGRIDSTGVFPSWYGAWRDRRDDSPPEGSILERVPALCGALLYARAEAMRDVERAGGAVFDERYFAYKEDIELSLRLRRAGWSLGLWHGAHAYHGRGWAGRGAMPRRSRVLSARNEVRLHAAYAPWRLPYSLAKWIGAAWLGW